MAWEDHHPFQPEILGDLARLTPLHDFVLVEPLSDDYTIKMEQPGAEPVLLFNPNVHMTKDYRWRSDRPRGNRFGRVVAVGRGDKLTGDDRAPMHVDVGDVVVFPRVPANEIAINGKQYVFIHEEQHLLAVMESE